MSLYDYHESKRILEYDPGFYALIMAAMMKGDSVNAMKLKYAFPDIWSELTKRYNAPGGWLEGEPLEIVEITQEK
jgi:hypothetical protein